MSSRVVDASALLALLNREPGWETVRRALQHQAYVSAVNWAEVSGKLSDSGMPDTEIQDILQSLQAEVVPLSAALSVRIGLLRRATRLQGLSLGDRACLALAASLGLPALTADRAWASAQLGIAVELIR